MKKTILVLTNLPDRASAIALAEQLVKAKLAACVNILGTCTSIYHWRGKIESAEETPMLIKTTADAYPVLEQTIRELHPYELPEIIHVPITGGLPAYLQWVAAETQP
ncbi:MAG: divalent-cation tolerance protein CutA [Nitrosomonadales bacterium]|jgi:periplasmic divalent cation tolerance protein|nr:MAG: divalent-cation tolerance protein CutA [Nitrosomonadales bacterium]